MDSIDLPLPPFLPKAKLLVAVSGGSDSLCLLQLLLDQIPNAQRRLAVAHVNYGLRGLDSAKDEQKARDMAQASGLPFHLLRVQGFQVRAAREKKSPQDFAREIRYGFFSRLVSKERAWGVAVAHHLEDQAETVLDRLLRGAGARGLSGLKAAQEIPFGGKPLKIWRPLLSFPKESLRHYLSSKKIIWREDRTNQKDGYRRNQIRHRVIPFLSRWNPRLVDILSRLGQTTAAEDDYLESLMAGVGKTVQGRWTRNACHFSASAFEKLPLALQRRWVRKAAEELYPDARGFSFERIEEVIRLWTGKEKGPRDLGFGLRAGRRGLVAFLEFQKAPGKPQPFAAKGLKRQ